MFIWNPALYMDEKVKEEPKKFVVVWKDENL